MTFVDIMNNMISSDNPDNVREYYDCCRWVYIVCFKINYCCFLISIPTIIYFISFGITYGYIITKHPGGLQCNKEDIGFCYVYSLITMIIFYSLLVISYGMYKFLYMCFRCIKSFKTAYHTTKTEVDETTPLVEKEEVSIEVN